MFGLKKIGKGFNYVKILNDALVLKLENIEILILLVFFVMNSMKHLTLTKLENAKGIWLRKGIYGAVWFV